MKHSNQNDFRYIAGEFPTGDGRVVRMLGTGILVRAAMNGM